MSNYSNNLILVHTSENKLKTDRFSISTLAAIELHAPLPCANQGRAEEVGSSAHWLILSVGKSQVVIIAHDWPRMEGL